MADSDYDTNFRTQDGHAGRIGLPKLTHRQWALHIGLLLVTFATTTICGIVMALPTASGDPTASADAGGFAGSLWLIPWYYVLAVVELIRYAFAHPAILKEGVVFSGSLLAILASHESGHYFFCRYYGVNATLPFFIPQPPLLIPGTFGAFIRMKSVVPSRRALFDIGLAGPLAGFIVMVPLAFVGVSSVKPMTGPALWYFHDPLLFHLFAWTLGVNLANTAANNVYLAAWFGALVTALNLMPVGQLDGGHGTFSVFGQRAHSWIGRIAFVSMAIFSVLGWFWHNSPAGFVYVVLLAVLLRVRHPQPQQMEPLGLARTIVAVFTAIVFVLCFLPFPITIN